MEEKKRKKRENGSGIQMKMVVKGMVSLIVQSVFMTYKDPFMAGT